jgi:PadR family transcriptional regulator, regulatory protein PadR
MSNPFGPPVDFLVLAVLRTGPAHGYAIVQFIQQLSGGRLFLQDGVVYPALHRLEAKGLVGRTWLIREGRRTGVYDLTDAGREVLAAQLEEWANLSSLVQAILDTNVAAGTAVGASARSAVRLPTKSQSRPRRSLPRSRKARICVICGKAIPSAMNAKRKTCSPECSARLRSQSNTRVGRRKIRACRVCENPIPWAPNSNRWTCSAECSSRLRSLVQKERHIDPPCLVCGNPVRRRRPISRAVPKTCSEECYRAALEDDERLASAFRYRLPLDEAFH